MSEPRTASEPRTEALAVPGARLRYDVRDAAGKPTAPPLLLIALPMSAAGFATLAGHFQDRMVVTYDPRGIGRSERTDGARESTVVQHADDVRRLISAVDAGPVDIFGSSGGAVTGLVLVGAHHEQVRTLVAHEPPAAYLLPDGEEALAAFDHVRETYQRDGFGAAMAKFMVLSSLKGPIPAEFSQLPSPSPGDFGFPAEDDGSRDDPLLGENNRSTTYEHDFGALREVSTRIVVGAGVESEGEMTHRAALAVAEHLGIEAVIFPSHHGGFLGGEFGWRGDPDAFAVTLREVLDGG
jgi:pimeloyl-ACP methyl ester carboxylesterase